MYTIQFTSFPYLVVENVSERSGSGERLRTFWEWRTSPNVHRRETTN